MEKNQRRRSITIFLVILLTGLYLATVTVDPVFAWNISYKPKIMDKGIKIDKIDKDKKDKDKKDKDDTIKIKSHPVLKSSTVSSGMSTMSLSPLRPKYYKNETGND